MNMRKFGQRLLDDRGAVMLETVLIVPILVFLTFASIQIAALVFTINSLSHITFEAARAMSVGQLDDETDGYQTNCNSISGLAAGGSSSVEAFMCNKVAILPGTFLVSASDGNAISHGDIGSPITTNLILDTSSILFFDPNDAIANIGFLSASAQQIKEPTPMPATSGGNDD